MQLKDSYIPLKATETPYMNPNITGGQATERQPIRRSPDTQPDFKETGIRKTVRIETDV